MSETIHNTSGVPGAGGTKLKDRTRLGASSGLSAPLKRDFDVFREQYEGEGKYTRRISLTTSVKTSRASKRLAWSQRGCPASSLLLCGARARTPPALQKLICVMACLKYAVRPCLAETKFSVMRTTSRQPSNDDCSWI